MKDVVKDIRIGASVMFIFFIFIFAFTALDDNGSPTILINSMRGKDGNADMLGPAKIILQKAKEATGALFDIVLTIPENSRLLTYGENLPISIELINFGGPGKTNVSISYIITNSRGDIVLIEHEDKTVYTQTSFLKVIELGNAPMDDYKIFVEMLYSNTSATATGEFSVVDY